MSSSTILRYNQYTKTIGSVDGVSTLKTILSFPKPIPLTLQVMQFNITINIPNVYNYNGTNNGLARFSPDGGASWTNIQLPNGVYTIPMIEAAFNTALAAWWATPAVPGFHLRYNLATSIVYIEIDSTALGWGHTQLGVDFSHSLISELLGFTDPANQTFITDGVFGAVEPANINWVGDDLLVWLNGFGPLSIMNGSANNLLSEVSLSSAFITSGATEYVFPLAIPSPIITTTSSFPSINRFEVKLTGSRKGSDGNYIPVYIQDGRVNLVIKVGW